MSANEFNLLDLFYELSPDEVRQAHELADSDSEPYVEEFDTAYIVKPGELPVGVPLFRNDNWY